MKTLDGLSWSLALTSLVVLTGCPDDISNPFESADTGGSETGDGSTAGDGDDVMEGPGDTSGSEGGTTVGADGTGTTDGGTTMMVDDGSTTAGAQDTGTTAGEDTDGTTGETEGGTTEGETTEGETTTDDGGNMATLCPAEVIGDLPTTISDSVGGEPSEFGSSCGGTGAPDLAYTLVAPQDGFYVFDTEGSSFDTVLYLLDGDCAGPELACNDDTTGGTSEVGVVLAEGQTVTVVVDSFGIAGGSFDLNIAVFGGTCPDDDIGSVVPQTINGDTTISDNTLFGSCGGGLASDDALTFTAPEPGIYTFDTIGSDYDTVLYVRDDCGGEELGCNDNITGGMTESQVNVTLEQDESVVVVVDGNSEDGNYVLNVSLDVCPDEALPSVSPQTVMGATTAEVNSSIPSCSGGSTAPDFAYTFIAPSAGTYIFDTNGSGFDTVLYAIDGASCDGSVTLDCDDDGGDGTQSQIVVTLAQDQEITVVVDGFSANSGDFVLNVDALGGVCPDADLGNGVPAMAAGDTSMSDDTIASSCGGLGAGDETYTFTAPQDGLYVFSTPGSAFTPTVAVFDSGDCTGAELACGDDAVGVALLQDQLVTVVVDGDTGEGAFNLEVDIDACPDDDAGNTVGQVLMDTTSGLSNSVDPSCGLGGSEDFGYLFTAPADATYVFDTNGTGHDTVLHLIDGAVCGGVELECDDDDGVGLQSQITIDLVADQQVIVMVDGYNGADGPFTLNIN